MVRSRCGTQFDPEVVAAFEDCATEIVVVAELAASAARHHGLPDADATVLRRAGLAHDLGRMGVSNSV